MDELTEYIARYYDRDAQHEWERMERHRTEFAVTLRAMEKYLPPPPARVLDCGGGPGRYAIELAKRGYRVTLFDLSPGNLQLAQEKVRAADVTLEAIEQGSATDLTRFAEDVFDAVLLMGPLYHLLEVEQRQQALSEARRVLKSGGPLLASFITRYSAHRYAAVEETDWILLEEQRSEELLHTGKLLPVEKDGRGLHGFVAYMAHPSEVAPLCWKAGLEFKELLGLEGLVSHAEDQINLLDGELWERWVALNERVASDPCIHGCVEHLLAVTFKPRWRAVLQQIARRLNADGVTYNLAGGASLALHGLPLPVRDVDIETDVEGAYRIQEIFANQLAGMFTVKEPVALGSTELYRSHIGRFDFQGVQVEVMGDNQRREGDEWVATRALTAEMVDLDGTPVRTSWLEEETLAYIRRGRLERAALCLPYCQRERLLALMRRETPTQVY